MIKVFAIQQLDGEISAVSADRTHLEKLIEEHPLIGIMSEIVQIDFNDEPMTERGVKLKEQIEQVWKDRQILNFHMNKQAGFFTMSADDRLQLLHDMLTLDHLEEPNFREIDLVVDQD